MTLFKKIGIDAKPVKSTMIAGGGKICYYLTQKLLRAKQKVKIIEKNVDRCQELSVSFPKAMIICGDTSDEALLDEEGINEVDAFVSLTNFDEGNVLTSLYANESSGAKIITKISKISFEKILSTLPIGTTVYSKYITAEKITHYVRAMSNSEHFDEILTISKILGGKAEALEWKINSNSIPQRMLGVPLMHLKIRHDIIIGCITRKGKIIIPNGDETLEIGDTVVVVTKTSQTNKIITLADIFEKGQ